MKMIHYMEWIDLFVVLGIKKMKYEHKRNKTFTYLRTSDLGNVWSVDSRTCVFIRKQLARTIKNEIPVKFFKWF